MVTEPPPADSIATLTAHAEHMRTRTLRELFAEDARRFERFSWQHEDILLDASKQLLTTTTLQVLRYYARHVDLAGWREKKASGELINHTEGRAVRHMDLRAGAAAPPEVQRVLGRMQEISDAVRSGQWRGYNGEEISDVVSIGIGGSDLGPRMVVRAMSACLDHKPRVHFVANVDGADLARCLDSLKPANTLFLVASKTFGTQETLQNARSARDWLLGAAGDQTRAVARHFIAMSTNHEATTQFGIAPENVLEFRDWVGGRFSLWSAIGLPIALACGFVRFTQLLDGARSMDEHFLLADDTQNLPLTLALIDFWNHRFLGAATHAILPYSDSLALLPAYLQQLEMESNGKRADRDGELLPGPACPIVWGEPGTNAQHSFFQLLHQGGQLVPCDFIALARPDWPLAGHHRQLLGNCLAQSSALAFGQNEAEARANGTPESLLPHQIFPGNQPSTTLLLSELTPASLGRFIALYEHKVFCLGVLWHLNSFDQWGVELGKRIARRLTPYLSAADATHIDESQDSSTRGLIDAMRRLYPPGEV